jgi:hypothetical protein
VPALAAAGGPGPRRRPPLDSESRVRVAYHHRWTPRRRPRARAHSRETNSDRLLRFRGYHDSLSHAAAARSESQSVPRKHAPAPQPPTGAAAAVRRRGGLHTVAAVPSGSSGSRPAPGRARRRAPQGPGLRLDSDRRRPVDRDGGLSRCLGLGLNDPSHPDPGLAAPAAVTHDSDPQLERVTGY